MHLEASFANTLDKARFTKGLLKIGKELGMEIKVHFDERDRLKNMAIFVSKEPHCLELILDTHARGDIKYQG